MMGNYKKTIFSLLLIALISFLPTTDLSARVETGYTTNDKNYVCVDKLMYNLVSDTGRTVKENAGRITKKDIDNGFLDIEGSRDEAGNIKEEYQFKAIPTGTICVRKDEQPENGFYRWDTCPINRDGYRDIDDIKKVTTLKENAAGNGYVLTINDASGLRMQKTENMVTDFNPNSYNLLPNSAGTLVVNLKPGEAYYISFAVNGGDCNGAFVGYIQGVASKMTSNKYYYDGTNATANNKVCTDYMNKYKDNVFAKSLVPTCNTAKIDLSNGNPLTKINTEIANAEKVLARLGHNEDNSNIKLQCDFVQSNNVSNIYVHTDVLKTSTNKYWTATCTETLKVTYDTPKAVNPGNGFAYEVKVEMVRNCNPVQIARPVYRPTCEYGIECYGGAKSYQGSPGAGPTEDFDKCVNDLDGGQYKQSSIEQCYDEVYGNEKITTANKTSNVVNQRSASAEQVSFRDYNDLNAWFAYLAQYRSRDDTTSVVKNCIIGGTQYTSNPLSSCRFVENNAKCDPNTRNVWGTLICYSEHGKGVGYHNVCNNTKCYEVFISDPNCIANAEADYQEQVRAVQAELSELHSLISSYTNKDTTDEINTIRVLDNVTGNVTTYKTKTNNAPAKEESVTANKTSRVENIADGVNAEVNGYTVERTVKIKFSKAYVSAIKAGEVIYGGVKDNKSYYDGGNKYYTNLNSGYYNSVDRWPYYIGYDNKNVIAANDKSIYQSIAVVLENYGSWNQWKNIGVDCFYGVEKIGTGDTTDGLSPQIEFVFRPVDLTNLFPNRDPRWNWSDKAINNRLYNVNPSKVVEEIQYKGNSIYKTSNVGPGKDSSEELDYEFTLSKNQIQNIRRYNAQRDSYLDYDMYCTSDATTGVKSCYSSFIKDANNISTYKSGLAGCNNELAGVCIDRYQSLGGGR